MPIISARNTDNPNPFKPAIQYLLSAASKARASIDLDIDLEDRGAQSTMPITTQSELLSSSIPLVTLSRSSSPYARKNSVSNPASDSEDEGANETSSRRPFLSQERRPTGFKGFMAQGGLGLWLFTTSGGWKLYVGFLALWLMGVGIGLQVINWLVLLTGVYKFPYPLTLSLIELIGGHLFLIMFANITRLFARYFAMAGLAGIVAPAFALPAPPSTTYRSQGRKSRIFRLFSKVVGNGSGGIAGGGMFEFNRGVARQTLLLSVVYVLKVLLSNISYAYAQLPMYILARIAIVPLTLLFSTMFNGASHSVPILSASLSATLNLLVATSRGNIRVTWESMVAGAFSSIFVALFPVLIQSTYKTMVASLSAQTDLLTSPYSSSAVIDASGSREESRAIWRLMHYVSLISILIFTPIVLVSGELGNIARNCYFLDEWWHWFMMACGSLGTFTVFFGTILLTKATSPLTVNFLMIPRAAFMIPILAKFNLPAYSWVGIALSWASCVWFIYVRSRESNVRR